MEANPTNRLLKRLDTLSDSLSPRVISLAMSLAAIPSPSGHEADKARFIRDWFVHNGDLVPHIDEIGNVIIELQGDPGSITQLYVAHIDTVFADSHSIEPRMVGHTVYAPSIGDNSCNVAALMLAVNAMAASNRKPVENRIIAFNVGEEGLGNLRGVRALIHRYGERIDEVIAIDATTDAVIDTAVGSLRYRIEVKTRGGHSYKAFGNASAIFHAAHIVQRLYAMQVPKTPKTTFNVGIIEGGTSVNTIAQCCSMLIDLRSQDAGCLERLNEAALAIIHGEAGQGVTVDVARIGERPCGKNIEDTSVRERILAIRKRIGLPQTCAAGSTDCNLPLSMGIPSICMGVYRGEGAHTTEEFIYADSVSLGMKQLLYLFFNVEQYGCFCVVK